MKRKMKSWISLLLCLMMVLQSVTAVAAEPEEGSQQPLQCLFMTYFKSIKKR